jgi:hypothetical protein
MNPNELLSSAVELALELMEKNGSFLPYCKAVNASGDTFVYAPGELSGEDITGARAAESVRFNVVRDLRSRGLVDIAVCDHTVIRFDSGEKTAAVRVAID